MPTKEDLLAKAAKPSQDALRLHPAEDTGEAAGPGTSRFGTRPACRDVQGDQQTSRARQKATVARETIAGHEGGAPPEAPLAEKK